MDFSGKAAISTGAASGMGLLFAQNFADLNGNVVLCDVNDEVLKEKVDEINSKGKGKVIGVHCDVRDYNQFASCECFRLFKTVSKESITGELLQPHERGYYMLCKDDAEYCCATLLQVLSQVYNIPPKNATECMEYTGELFEDNNYNENHSVNSTPSSNSGCAGMLALMLGIGGASVYGIVELISRLIA